MCSTSFSLLKIYFGFITVLKNQNVVEKRLGGICVSFRLKICFVFSEFYPVQAEIRTELEELKVNEAVKKTKDCSLILILFDVGVGFERGTS